MNNPVLKISFEIEFDWSVYEKYGSTRADFEKMIPKFAEELKEFIFEDAHVPHEKYQNFKYELEEE